MKTLSLKIFYLICLLGILFGLFSRIFLIDRPAAYLFDEHHFIDNALNLLVGLKDLNDHPPLGKWILALGISLFGNNTWGWRCMPLLFGSLNIFLAASVAFKLTRKLEASFLVSFFLSIDGMMITYTRTAHLETFILFFSLLTFHTLLQGNSYWWILWAGLSFGCSITVKWNAIALLVPIGLLLISRHQERRIFALLSITVLTYLAFLTVTAYLTRQEDPLTYFYRWSYKTWLHHRGLTDWVHPLLSKWYTWLFLKRPIPFENHLEEDGFHLKYITSLGNPLLWWSTSTALLAYGIRLILKYKRLLDRNFYKTPLFILFLFWAVFTFPWILTARDTYIYHYFPAYGFGLIFFGVFLQKIKEQYNYNSNLLPSLHFRRQTEREFSTDDCTKRVKCVAMISALTVNIVLVIFLFFSFHFWSVWVGWPILKGDISKYIWVKTWF